MSAVSIGTRPTFDNGERTIEAYLLDFWGDLYGQALGLSFVARLRPELRFEDAAALVAQMERDVAETRAILADAPDDTGPETAGEGWQELRHTADWTIQVQGETQRQLFARAASAMYQMQDADRGRPVTLARAVDVEGQDPGELLVAYLNRLLWAQEVLRRDVHPLPGERDLRAGAAGRRLWLPRRPAHTAVKAATYYDLDVRREADGTWTARITLDV